MNILITGANGFIGRVLCYKLITDGYHVRGVVRGVTKMTALSSRVEEVLVGDIGPDTEWEDALAGIDTVVHLAARVHVMRARAADPLAAFKLVNIAGTERLARQAAEAGVKRLVYISSVKVNGERTEDNPQITQITRIRKKMTEVGGRRSEIRYRKSEAGNREKTEIAPVEFHGVKRSPRLNFPGGALFNWVKRSYIRCQGSVSKQFFSEEDVPEPQDPYAVSK
ncbi:MAG: NAD-dependent epimerase/dehydratase family protein [Candidatus Desulfatibia sp.]|uniref:NAD-dependent epimerase/dehydratase family protein n=1 Tax=Candidatus Desulfatibia sp. TaxID=3101189 RepID=UPI002F3192C0